MNGDFKVDNSSNGALGVFVRGAGLFLLAVGLVVGLLAIWEALQLYHEPERIERFAEAIEKGSHIDKSLASLRASANTDTGQDETGVAPAPATATVTPAHESDNVRVSYFLSWVIVLLLLLLIARLALAAIKTGGELVLYDLQVKRLARMLMESGKTVRR